MTRAPATISRSQARTARIAGGRDRQPKETADHVLRLLLLAQNDGISLAELRAGIDRHIATTLTLRQAIDRVRTASGYEVAASYPTQVRQILDGLGAFTPPADCRYLPALPALPGFGDLPLTAFTVHALETFRVRAQQIIACRMIAARGTRLHSLNPDIHGWSAVWQIGLAAKAIGKDLKVDGVLPKNPMKHLHLRKPPKSDPFDAYLTPDQMLEYCWHAVVAHPSDAELAAFAWVVLRYTLARRGEVRSADLADLDPDRNLLMIWGSKRKTVRYAPLPRPLIEALTAFSERRPAPPGPGRQPLLPTKRGGRLSKHFFEDMSERLHAGAEWSRRHRICMHILRRTGTVDLELAGYGLLDLQAVLGHTRSPEVGATETYLLSEAKRRERVAERYFGWPLAWPEGLPEWSLLAPLLGVTAQACSDAVPERRHAKVTLRPGLRSCNRPHEEQASCQGGTSAVRCHTNRCHTNRCHTNRRRQ